MFGVNLDGFSKLEKGVQDYLLALDGQSQRRNQILEEILNTSADVLIKFIADDFKAKGTGASGASGVKWDKKKRDDGRPIGIGPTGNLLRGLKRDKAKRNRIVVRFIAHHAHLFDKRRILIPENIPPKWMEDVDAAVVEVLERRWDDIMQELNK